MPSSLAIIGLSLATTFYFFTPTKAAKKDLFLIGNTRIHIVDGDITGMRVQAIVNAANKALPWPAGGVCRVIYNAAGPEQLNAWVQKNVPVNENGDRIELGNAVVSPSFNLAKNGIQYIIHAVGPDCRSGEPVSALYDTYKNSLLCASALSVNSIAFPAISIGIFACDKKEAALHAVKALQEIAPKTTITDIYLTIMDAEYCAWCQHYLAKI